MRSAANCTEKCSLQSIADLHVGGIKTYKAAFLIFVVIKSF